MITLEVPPPPPLFPSRSSTNALQGSALRAWTSVHVASSPETRQVSRCFFFLPTVSRPFSLSLSFSLFRVAAKREDVVTRRFVCSIERERRRYCQLGDVWAERLSDGARRRSCRRLIRVSIVSNERPLLRPRSWPASASPGKLLSRCFAISRAWTRIRSIPRLYPKPNLKPRFSRRKLWRRFRNLSRAYDKSVFKTQRETISSSFLFSFFQFWFAHIHRREKNAVTFWPT